MTAEDGAAPAASEPNDEPGGEPVDEATDRAPAGSLEREVEQALGAIQPSPSLKAGVMAELRIRARAPASFEFDSGSRGLGEEPRELVSKSGRRERARVGQGSAAVARSEGTRGRLLRRLALAILLIGLPASVALVLLPEESPEPSPARGVPVRQETPPRFELEVPERMAVGDRLELTLTVRNPSDSRLTVAARSEGLDALAVQGNTEAQTQVAPGGVGRLRIEVLGRSPGLGRLMVALAWRRSDQGPEGADRRKTLSRAIAIRPPGRPIIVAARAILDGPSATARLELPVRALDLASIEELRIQVIPGTLAEMLAARETFGDPTAASMERNLAALWPMVLLGEQGSSGLTRRSLEWLVQHQNTDGGFALWSGGRSSARLTILGLRLLDRISESLPVPDDRIARARRSLLAQRGPLTHGPGSPTDPRAWSEDGRGGGSSGDVELTASAIKALAETGTDSAVLQASFDWLERAVDPSRASLTERLALARAWLAVPEGEERARALAAGLLDLAEPVSDDELTWPAPRDAGGHRARERAILRTAAASEVLGRLGCDAEADRALRWLLRNRPIDADDSGAAAFAAFEAVLAREQANPRLAAGTLALRVGRYSLPTLVVEAESGASSALQPAGLGPRETIAAVLASGLDAEFVGDGRVEVRLLVKGVEAWPDEAAPPTRRARESRLTVDFDALPGLRVDEAVAWTIRVRNAGELRVETPVVEVDLPAGFVLSGVDQLDELVHRQSLRGHERVGDRLRLILPPLDGGEQRELQLLVYARWPGQVSGGSVMVWRLDRPGGRRVRRSGRAFRIHSDVDPFGLGVTKSPSGDSDPGADPADPAKVSVASSADPEDSSELPLGAARRPYGADRVLRWDSEAGPLEPAWARLSLDRSNASKLLTLALHRGISEVATVRRVRGSRAPTWEFRLKETRWSDGRAMTVDDFTRSWERARGHWEPEETAFERSQAEALNAITWQRVSPLILRVSWPGGDSLLPDRLRRVPFLPTAEWSGDTARTYVSNGLWRVVDGSEDLILLGRGADGAGERVLVATTPFLEADRGEGRASVVDIVVRGAGRANRSRVAELALHVPPDGGISAGAYRRRKASFAAFLRPALSAIAGARGWTIPVALEDADLVEPITRHTRSYRMVWEGEDLEGPARALVKALMKAGVPVGIGSMAPGQTLSLGLRPAGGSTSQSVVLAVVPGILDAGQAVPARDAVNSSGYVRWPLRLEEPEDKSGGGSGR